MEREDGINLLKADTDRYEGFKKQKKRLEDKPGRPHTGAARGLRKKEIAREFKDFPMRTQHRYQGQDTLKSGHQEKGAWGCHREGRVLVLYKGMGQE